MASQRHAKKRNEEYYKETPKYEIGTVAKRDCLMCGKVFTRKLKDQFRCNVCNLKVKYDQVYRE